MGPLTCRIFIFISFCFISGINRDEGYLGTIFTSLSAMKKWDLIDQQSLFVRWQMKQYPQVSGRKFRRTACSILCWVSLEESFNISCYEFSAYTISWTNEVISQHLPRIRIFPFVFIISNHTTFSILPVFNYFGIISAIC